MSVGRICQRSVDLAEAEESAHVAAERMLQRQVGSLLVLDGRRRPLGILTDRDLVLRVLALGKNPSETRVRDIMSAGVKTASEDTPIEEAISRMRAGSFRRLPVVDKDGRLIGLVTLDDVIELLAGEFTSIGALLRREFPGSSAAS
jgi:CBS domain-containing protein